MKQNKSNRTIDFQMIMVIALNDDNNLIKYANHYNVIRDISKLN